MSAPTKYRCERCGRSISKGEIGSGTYVITRDGHLFCPGCTGNAAARPAPRWGVPAAGAVATLALALALWAAVRPAPAALPLDPRRTSEPTPAADPAARSAAVFETLFEKERARHEERDRAIDDRFARLEKVIEGLETRPLPVGGEVPDLELGDLRSKLATLEARLDALERELASMPRSPAGGVPGEGEPEPGAIDDPEIAGHVRDLFAPEATKRTTAAFALFEAKDRRTVPHLVRALDLEDAIVQSLAARTLGEMGEPDALEALERAMVGGGNPMVRLAAAEAVGKIGRPTSVPALIQALSDAEEQIRLEAIQILRRLTGEDMGFDPVAPEEKRLESVRRWIEWERSRR